MFSSKSAVFLFFFCTWYAFAFRMKNVRFKCFNRGILMDGKCVCKDGFSGDFCQIGKHASCQGKRLLTTVYDIISPTHSFSFIFSIHIILSFCLPPVSLSLSLSLSLSPEEKSGTFVTFVSLDDSYV